MISDTFVGYFFGTAQHETTIATPITTLPAKTTGEDNLVSTTLDSVTTAETTFLTNTDQITTQMVSTTDVSGRSTGTIYVENPIHNYAVLINSIGIAIHYFYSTLTMVI